MLARFKGFKEKYPYYWVSLYFVFYMIWFAWVESRANLPYHVIHFPLDDYIPFCEYFVIPYILWFGYIAVVYLWLFFHDKSAFFKYIHCGDLYGNDTVSDHFHHLSQWTPATADRIFQKQHFYPAGVLHLLGRYFYKYSSKHSCVQFHRRACGSHECTGTEKQKVDSPRIADLMRIHHSVHHVHQAALLY